MKRSCVPGLESGQRHPNWMILYEQAPEETLPWFIEKLDPDFEEVLKASHSQKSLLDIGSGLGGQADLISKLGFKVTGTEISPAAVRRSQEKYPHVQFQIDDVKETKLEQKFDYIIDRGCFHVLDVEDHASYIRSIRKLLEPGGTFLLKVFSSDMGSSNFGPLRFSHAALVRRFADSFELVKIKRTQFYCSTGNSIAAWFLVMRGKQDV